VSELVVKMVLIVAAFAAFIGGWLLCLHTIRMGYRMGWHEQIDRPAQPGSAAEFDVIDERERRFNATLGPVDDDPRTDSDEELEE